MLNVICEGAIISVNLKMVADQVRSTEGMLSNPCCEVEFMKLVDVC